MSRMFGMIGIRIDSNMIMKYGLAYDSAMKGCELLM